MIIKKLDIEVLLLGLWLREGFPPKKMYKCYLQPFRGGFVETISPYCKVYTQRKYTWFFGKTTVKKIPIRTPNLTIGGESARCGRGPHFYMFRGDPFPKIPCIKCSILNNKTSLSHLFIILRIFLFVFFTF